MTNKNKMQIVAAVERGDGDNKKSYWTRIGIAFENKDGSYNMLFDYFPTNPRSTIQLRPFDPQDE